jgi:Mg2+ and Co2+ transporter CorA
MNRRFDWTRRRRDLLIKLLFVLSGTIREWNLFISSDGDVGYLSDLDEIPTSSPAFHQSSHAGQSLRSIKQAFGRLEEDRQRLLALKEWFSSDFTTLKLFLSLEGNDATANSAFLSKFTIWVLCPYSLAAGFFSMQPTVIPVDLTFRWFLIIVLILMGIMVVIQWVMMRWSGWRDRFLAWLKLKRIEEEESRRGLRSEYENDRIPDFHQYRADTDLESLGTRALSGRRLYSL